MRAHLQWIYRTVTMFSLPLAPVMMFLNWGDWGQVLAWFALPPALGLYPALRPNNQWNGPVTTGFVTDEKEVWLTIDDGPDPIHTPQILDLLDQHCARATFFVIGEKARKYPQLVEMIRQRGHGLANHSDTHPVRSFWGIFPRGAKQEIDACDQAIKRNSNDPQYFRAPVGMANCFVHAVVQQRRIRLIGWSHRGLDGLVPDAARAVDHILQDLRPGSIILLHEGKQCQETQQTSVHCVAQSLVALASSGYKCVLPDLTQLRTAP